MTNTNNYKLTKTSSNAGLEGFIGYQEYEADKRKRLGEEGAKPKRIRYKPISR